MKNRTIEVLIDVGSSAVRVVIAEVGGQRDTVLLGVGCAENTGIRHGNIVDMEKLCDALQRAIDDAERDADLKINSAWYGVSGEVFAVNTEASIYIRQRNVSEEDMAQLRTDAASNVQDRGYHLLHVLPQQYSVDEYEGIMQPKGMVADQLGIRAHVLQSPVLKIRNLRQCSDHVGIDADGFIFAGLAASQAVVSEDERQLGCCVADIGAGTVDFVAWYQGQPVFSGSLRVGGEYASSDLAQLLKIPRTYAETLKCSQGSLADVDDNGHVAVSSTGLRGDRQVPRAEINEILRCRYRETLSMLSKELHRGGCLRYMHAGLVLTGGAARIKGLESFAAQAVDMPVRIARPQSISGLAGHDDKHCFAAVLGMAEMLAHPFEDGAWETPAKQGIIERIKLFFNNTKRAQ